MRLTQAFFAFKKRFLKSSFACVKYATLIEKGNICPLCRPKARKNCPPTTSMMKCAKEKAQGSRAGGGDAGVHTRLAHGAKWGGRVGGIIGPNHQT